MPEFDFAFVEVRLLQDIPFNSSRVYPLRSVVLFLFPLFHYPFISLILLTFPLSCVGTIGIGCDRTGVGVLAIGRHVGVTLLLRPISDGDCCHDVSREGVYLCIC